jgi:uncharacterized protein
MPALIVVGCAGTPAREHVANRNQFRESRSSQSRHTHFSNLRPPCHHRGHLAVGASGKVGDMSVTVVDDSMESRYEARIDGELVGLSQYELTADTIVFLHTVVRQEYEGQGVGSAIARFALDDARARGLLVRPLCPYIRGWLGRHPEYSDLLSSSG